MDDWDDNYDDDDEEGGETPVWRRPVVLAAAAAVIVALIAVGYVVLNKDDVSTGSSPTTTGVVASNPAAAPTTAAADAPVSAAVATTTGVSTTATGVSTTAAATTAPPTTAARSTTTPTTASAETTPTEAPTTVAAAPPAGAATYSTLPDGSPAPIIAVFGTDSNTLTGAVPDQASKEKLQALIIAYSKAPVPVNNLLTIDPTVPIGIGVRVVELTSARFEPNSAVVQGFHALELDRVVSAMNALPNTTALVIGHADQIGSDAQNFKISAERAAAVVDYMVSKGISPSRLSSRAVGDNDLLTLNDDAASLALNRRTEFVLYGLLSS